jgi:hypothetical protein
MLFVLSILPFSLWCKLSTLYERTLLTLRLEGSLPLSVFFYLAAHFAFCILTMHNVHGQKETFLQCDFACRELHAFIVDVEPCQNLQNLKIQIF